MYDGKLPIGFKLIMTLEDIDAFFGLPYTETTIRRLMDSTEIRRSLQEDGTWKEWPVENKRQFPKGRKMFEDVKNSPYVWQAFDILEKYIEWGLLGPKALAYLKKFGILD